jgi:hypothetical protein
VYRQSHRALPLPIATILQAVLLTHCLAPSHYRTHMMPESENGRNDDTVTAFWRH